MHFVSRKIMPKLIASPTVIEAAGNKPKLIEEFAGHVNSGHSSVSVARMKSPGGWVEPGQRPDLPEIFDAAGIPMLPWIGHVADETVAKRKVSDSNEESA